MKNLHKFLASKSIYAMFQYDLQAKPDSTFVEHTETNSVGKEIKCYYKKLAYKECDVFDELEIIVPSENEQNVTFRGRAPKDVGEICRIIGDITRVLYTLFGKDASGNGIFTADEIGAYNLGIFNRYYFSTNPEVSLDNLRDNILSMHILGINTNSTETKRDAKPKKNNIGCTVLMSALLLLFLWYFFFLRK
jgi:hypothetical protein